MEYKLTYTITEKDFMELNRLNTLHGKNVIMLIVCLLLVIGLSLVSNSFSGPQYLLYVGSMVAAFVLTFLLIFFVGVKAAYKTNWIMKMKNDYLFTEDTITQTNERGSSLFKKEDIKKILCSKKIIAIFVTRTNALIIPRSAFATEEEASGFESFVMANYRKNK